MKDQDKTKAQLIDELKATRQSMAKMRQRLAKLEALESRHKQAEETLATEGNILRVLIDNLPDYLYAKHLLNLSN